ncbi:MAG: rRNA maturation RNase YbeY [Betaproteobacteria bacterium]|nr:rRNA maturation RNase YbeY [Betaproteobacteria bacterium]
MRVEAGAQGRNAGDAAVRLTVQVATGGAKAPSRAKLRRWARAAVRRSAEVTVRVVGVAESRRLNHAYRRRDRPANVLSFAYGRRDGALLGDVVLCAPVIRREARTQGKTPEAHFAHLTVHGLLHLQGYDHHGPREARRMESREKKILAQLGFPDPYGD